MPETCEHCPLKDRPGVACEATVTGHRRYCELIDPGHEAYRPAYIGRVRELSLRRAGLWVEPARGPRPTPAPVPKPAAFPPLATQAVGFARSLARHVKSGMPKASPEVLDARLATCEGCEKYRAGRCLACGCGVKRKAAWAQESCPLNKWPA